MNPYLLIALLIMLIGILAIILYVFDHHAIKPARDAEKEFFDRNWREKL
jgi:hypothetical protein